MFERSQEKLSQDSQRPWKVLEFDCCLKKCLIFHVALKMRYFPVLTNIHCIELVSNKNIAFMMKNKRKWYNILKNISTDVNSLAPEKFEWNFRFVIFKQILVIDDWGISCEIALTWKSQDLTDDKLTLVQVMAWCHHTTSHYLSQCWPSSLSPYGVTRPQWVKGLNIMFSTVYTSVSILCIILLISCKTWNSG